MALEGQHFFRISIVLRPWVLEAPPRKSWLWPEVTELSLQSPAGLDSYQVGIFETRDNESPTRIKEVEFTQRR